MRGSPYFMRLGTGLGSPKQIRFGADFAGTVEAVGKDVTKFKSGDRVFGAAAGAFAEYLTFRENRAALIPDDVSFEEAASLPIAAITALQALRDKGNIEPGQKVLINGASGGVGTFAVQIAKSMGAEVTGVCSTRNVEMVRSLGADHVIDYKKEDYTEGGEQYDVIVDMVGNRSLSANRSVLTSAGHFVIIGGSKGNWLGPLMGPINAMIVNPFIDQEVGMMIAHIDGDDLAELANLMERGELSVVIDRRYSLSEVPDAIRYSEEGHARGKIIISLEP
jgi:NADPH:quinone reductase-like Zn-dependent oxidoreductase